jgi:NAD(P)-dependent dehydrogenase (short-subunit alcohol dehydrogenase family)
MELDLAGGVQLVTGANRGIGVAIADELAREGMQVSSSPTIRTNFGSSRIVYRTQRIAKLRSIRPTLRGFCGAASAIATAVAHHRRLDLLVDNAGRHEAGGFFTLTEADGFALKSHDYVGMTRATWPHLHDSKGSIGNIVGIGSRAGSR